MEAKTISFPKHVAHFKDIPFEKDSEYTIASYSEQSDI